VEVCASLELKNCQ